MKKHLILFINTLIITISLPFGEGQGGVFAQQLPQHSQYYLNDYLMNPAIGGTRSCFEGRLNQRNQWTGGGGKQGINDAPRTFILSLNGALKGKNMGLGGIVTNDVAGPVRQTGFNASYSYQVKVTETSKLSFGLSSGVKQFVIDGAKLNARDGGDIAVSNATQSVIIADFNFGLHYYSDKYFVGASIPQITENKLKLFVKSNDTKAKLETHYFVYGGYKFDINDNFKIQPMVLAKLVAPTPVQVDISTRFIYQEKIWLGGTYRVNDDIGSINIMLGINIKENCIISYSYDLPNSSVNKYTLGSHEVMLGMNFCRKTSTATPSLK